MDDFMKKYDEVKRKFDKASKDLIVAQTKLDAAQNEAKIVYGCNSIQELVDKKTKMEQDLVSKEEKLKVALQEFDALCGSIESC